MYVVKFDERDSIYEVGYYDYMFKNTRKWVIAARSFDPISIYGICSWLNGGSFPAAPVGYMGLYSDYKVSIYALLRAVPESDYESDYSADDD